MRGGSFRLSALVLPAAFLRVAAHESWRLTVVIATVTYLFFTLIFFYGLHVPFPPGGLSDLLDLNRLDSYVMDPIVNAVIRFVGGH